VPTGGRSEPIARQGRTRARGLTGKSRLFQADTDENGFVKPDFSELEKYFEIIRWEYDFTTPRLYFVVKVRREIYCAGSGLSIFTMRTA